jgi:tRNA A-37 threonylcarbamoyl transferase component Bud32
VPAVPKSDEIPEGFRRISTDPVFLVVDASLEEAARTLSLHTPGGVDRLFTRGGGAAGRGETALVEIPGSLEKLVLRRLLHGGLLGPLLGAAFLGMGRPLRELQVTARLRRAGAPVPRPALALGRRIAGPFWAPVVGTYLEPNAVDALAFLEAGPDRSRLLRAAEAMGGAVRRFHDEGGRHADLNVKNLLIRERGDTLECIVIDLDKARVTPVLTPAERMAQIMRLFRSLLKRGQLERVGSRGCSRFFRAYCGDDRMLRRALWKRLDRELHKLAIHKLGYRRDS